MKKIKIRISNRNLKCWFLNFIFSFFIFNFAFSIPTTIAELPNRIISLAPNLTEILYALGLGDRIVGVTTFCDYPEDAKQKQKIGGMTNPSLEAIVSLRPDLVVMTTDGNPKEFEERIRSLKIKTYVLKARQISELPKGIRDMGLALWIK
jgi:iron complex transport system substrate-binding protein